MIAIIATGCGGGSSSSESNHKPAIKSLTDFSELAVGESKKITVEAVDKDGDALTFKWNANQGSIEGNGKSVTYTAPSTAGVDNVSLLVNDGKETVSTSFQIKIIDKLIRSLNIAKNNLMTEEKTTLTADLGEASEISWTAEQGNIEGSGKEVTYIAPSTEVNDIITLTVKDSDGNEESESIDVSIKAPYMNINLGDSNNYLFVSEEAKLIVSVDSNQNINSIEWNSSNGTITGEGQEVAYKAPNSTGIDTISVKVIGDYTSKAGSIEINIINRASLTADSGKLVSGQNLNLNVTNIDNEFVTDTKLTAEYGKINNEVYTAPDHPCQDTITLTVNYVDGKSENVSLNIEVEKLITASGMVSLHVPKHTWDDINGYDYNPYFPDAMTNRLLNGYLWHHVATGLNLVYEYNPSLIEGLAPVKVAVIDSGVDIDHPQLVDRLIEGKNYVTDADTLEYDPNNWEDNNGHGTHVAGLIGAERGDNGVIGIAPNVEIMPLKVSDNGLTGGPIVVQAIREAILQNVNIVNISIGLLDTEHLKDAIQDTYTHNIVTTASSGNSSASSLDFPAGYPETLGVGGVTIDLTKLNMSHWGEGLDFVAPAFGIVSTWNDGEDYSLEGTSQASPIIAGLSALVLGKHPSYSPDQVKAELKKYSFDLNTEGWDEYTGYGLPNAYHILSEKSVEDIIVFVGKRQGDKVERLSEEYNVTVDHPTNLSDKGEFAITETIATNDYSIFAWLDINDNGTIDLGDYLGEYDSGNIELSPLEKDYI